MNPPSSSDRVSSPASEVVTTTRRVRRWELVRNRKLWLLAPLAGIPFLFGSLANGTIENDLEGRVASALDGQFGEVRAGREVKFRAQNGTICVGTDGDAAAALASELRGVGSIEVRSGCAASPAAGAGEAPAPTEPPATDAPAQATEPAPTEPAPTEPAPTEVPATGAPPTEAPLVSSFVAAAAFDGQGMVLTCVVDNDEQRQALVEAAITAMGGDAGKVVDRMTLASPPGPAGAGPAEGVAQLIAAMPPNLVSGRAGYDQDLYLEGIYTSDAARDAVAGVARATDAGRVALEPVPVATEEQATNLIEELNALFLDKTIQFAPNSATILPESEALLDDAAARLKQFDLSSLQLVVEGHTDSDGSDAANLELSQRRAEAVVAALVQRGVADAPLVPQGFGEARPVADNSTPEGRALNRRVQLAVAR